MRSQIFAHRGASRHAVENTLPAIAEAIRLGADGVELDVRMTLDQRLVVIHDDDLMRLTGEPGRISALTYDDLRSRTVRTDNAPEGAPMARLDEALSLIASSDLWVNLELKTDCPTACDFERDVVRAVERAHLSDRTIYSSFNHLSVKALVDLGLGPHTGLLFTSWLYRPWDYAGTIGAAALHPALAVLAYPDLIPICHENHLAVRTWTADAPDALDMAFTLGVDAVITNDIETALLRREAAQGPHARP